MTEKIRSGGKGQKKCYKRNLDNQELWAIPEVYSNRKGP